MDKWEKCQEWCKKYSTEPKAEKEKERKERPSSSYRCHVSSNSFKVNNSILNPCAEALFAFITRDKKMTKIREQGRRATKLSPSRSRPREEEESYFASTTASGTKLSSIRIT